MRKPRRLLAAAIGASSLLFGCTKVYGNPKTPPPDGPAPDSVRVDAPAADALTADALTFDASTLTDIAK